MVNAFLKLQERTVAAERLKVQEFPWERPQRSEPDRLGRAVPHESGVERGGGLAAAPGFLPHLFREAAEAIRAAEERAAAIEQDLKEAARAERTRAEAAEQRAQAAEKRLADLEQRAVEAIRALERRAEMADARVQAAERWIARVRHALEQPTDIV
jgi:DNA repair exonuclease SbcCD ATPase subunit